MHLRFVSHNSSEYCSLYLNGGYQNNQYPLAWRLAGSTDGSTWDPIGIEQTTCNGGVTTTFNSTTLYSYFRVCVNRGIHSQVSIAEMAVSSPTIPALTAYVAPATLLPNVTNTYSLGTSGNCWSAVWTTLGTVSMSDSAVKVTTPLTYGLSELLKIDTIKYQWKSQTALSDDDPAKNYYYYGVCADQVAPILPELIYTDQSPYMLNYSELIPVCINAIKDLSAANTDLQEQLAQTNAAVAALSAKP